MSVLLDQIKQAYPSAADTLELADFLTDSDIQSLTRDDLRELFPEAKNLKMRRAIFEIIHKQEPINVLLNELKDFIPQESLRAALTDNGVLVGYLKIMKEMKSQVDKVQFFFDAHIGLLEDIRKTPPGAASSSSSSKSPTGSEDDQYKGKSEGHPQGARGSLSSISTSALCGSAEKHNDFHKEPQGTYGEPYRKSLQEYKEVMYQMVVSGETFNADTQLMEHIKAEVKDGVQLTLSSDGLVVILFCPISSRVGTDVKAAMTNVSGDKPVILVLMHYTREVKAVPSRGIWSDYPHVVLHVNTFYHDTMHGLLKCQENNDAVCEIQKKILEYSVTRTKCTSDNEWDMSTESSWSGSLFRRGKDQGSYTDTANSHEGRSKNSGRKSIFSIFSS